MVEDALIGEHSRNIRRDKSRLTNPQLNFANINTDTAGPTLHAELSFHLSIFITRYFSY